MALRKAGKGYRGTLLKVRGLSSAVQHAGSAGSMDLNTFWKNVNIVEDMNIGGWHSCIWDVAMTGKSVIK